MTDVFMLVLGCSLITYSLRGPALVLFGELEVPAWGYRALPFVPIVVLSAFVAPGLINPSDFASGQLWVANPSILAGLVAIVVSAWRGDLATPVLAALLVYYSTTWAFC